MAKRHKDSAEPLRDQAASSATRLKRTLEFLNTKFGLVVAGFILTSVLGGGLSWWFHRLDEDHAWHQEQFVRDQQEQQKEIDSQRASTLARLQGNVLQARETQKLIEDPILQRLAQSEYLVQIHGRRTTDKESEEAWANYWRAYHDYFLFTAANQMPRDRTVGTGAAYLDKNPVLWRFLETKIDPEFERVHACIVAAHQLYVPSVGRVIGPADSKFKSCVRATGNDDSFWAGAWDGTNQVDAWGRFKGCVSTFVLQIEYELKFREELAAEDPEPDKPHDSNKCHGDYGGDQFCNQVDFTRDTYAQMAQDCGELSAEEKQALDLPLPKTQLGPSRRNWPC